MTQEICQPFHSCEDHSQECPDFGPCPKCDKTEWIEISEMKEVGINYWLLDPKNLIGRGFLRPDDLIIYDKDFTPDDFDKPVMYAEIKPPEVPK